VVAILVALDWAVATPCIASTVDIVAAATVIAASRQWRS